MCVTTNAQTTGNALFSYYSTKEDGEWVGESEQRINLTMRGRAGLENLLALNLGIMRRDKKLEFLGGFFPTYAISLRGRRYNLISGYSVTYRRDIVNSRLYHNVTLAPPKLPTFSLLYSRQNTKDTQKTHNINSTNTSVQIGIEDEIGPFRIALGRRTQTRTDPVRGPEYDAESSDTFGNIHFAYLYRKMLSLDAQYRMSQIRTEKGFTGKIEGKTQDLSMNLQISPISTIVLSGATIARRQRRESSTTQSSLYSGSSDALANRLQLMLQPVTGITLNASYSRSDDSRDEKLLSTESKLLTLYLEPRQNLAFTGYFTVHDSKEDGRKISTLRRDSFDLRAEPIRGLRILSRLNVSESDNLANRIRNDRNNMMTELEAMLTDNLRTNAGYEWQNSKRISRNVTEEENLHRIALGANYSFARILDLNLRYSRGIYTEVEEDTDLLSCALSFSADKSHISLRYSQTSRLARSLPLQGTQWTTRVVAVQFEQELSRDATMFLGYDSRFGRREFEQRRTKRVSFRMNIRF